MSDSMPQPPVFAKPRSKEKYKSVEEIENILPVIVREEEIVEDGTLWKAVSMSQDSLMRSKKGDSFETAVELLLIDLFDYRRRKKVAVRVTNLEDIRNHDEWKAHIEKVHSAAVHINEIRDKLVKRLEEERALKRRFEAETEDIERAEEHVELRHEEIEVRDVTEGSYPNTSTVLRKVTYNRRKTGEFGWDCIRRRIKERKEIVDARRERRRKKRKRKQQLKEVRDKHSVGYTDGCVSAMYDSNYKHMDVSVTISKEKFMDLAKEAEKRGVDFSLKLNKHVKDPEVLEEVLVCLEQIGLKVR